jgi:hypothetical protein
MALSQGESIVMTAALNAAFADNPAPVVVIEASGSSAVLELELPGLDVLPEKKAHVTPSGRLSSKAWTKTELNQVYAELWVLICSQRPARHGLSHPHSQP